MHQSTCLWVAQRAEEGGDEHGGQEEEELGDGKVAEVLGGWME